jgi:hypothetical protein
VVFVGEYVHLDGLVMLRETGERVRLREEFPVVHLDQERCPDFCGVETDRYAAPEVRGIVVRVGNVPEVQTRLEFGSGEVVHGRSPRRPGRRRGCETLG